MMTLVCLHSTLHVIIVFTLLCIHNLVLLLHIYKPVGKYFHNLHSEICITPPDSFIGKVCFVLPQCYQVFILWCGERTFMAVLDIILMYLKTSFKLWFLSGVPKIYKWATSGNQSRFEENVHRDTTRSTGYQPHTPVEANVVFRVISPYCRSGLHTVNFNIFLQYNIYQGAQCSRSDDLYISLWENCKILYIFCTFP